jgi:UDP-2-acetamido-3-amino-2,3-dideoxy-glucuronate N-acetyltransferase
MPPSDVRSEPTRVRAVRVFNLPLISERRGQLSYGQFDEQIPFIPKRYFIVFDVPQGIERGGHAHRDVHQFLVCVTGSCSVAVDDGASKDEIILDGPARGVYIPPLVWAAQRNYSAGAVLLVLASDVYNEDEYIRDYADFLRATSRA